MLDIGTERDHVYPGILLADDAALESRVDRLGLWFHAEEILMNLLRGDEQLRFQVRLPARIRYVFFDGHVKAGAFGDWKTGVSEKFIEARQDITPKDRQRIAQQMRDAAVQRERMLRATQARAAKDCVSIWNDAGGDC